MKEKVLFVYEADGSKQLPLKYYVNTDPVFLPGTTKIYACVGLRCLGQTLEQCMFRYQNFCATYD